ncbi:MAG: glycolate oxidase subunit GlcE [Brachymonas sp.]|nr:glycolate oxidase subunit GlcE [Brachymonas sp.]
MADHAHTAACTHTARPGERPASTSESHLLEQVRAALHAHQPLRMEGGNTKSHLGRPVQGEVLRTTAHSGIVHYDPTELVLTARCGTPLREVEAALAERGQMLACEPPHHGDAATVGGMVAAGLSGPRRPWAGAVRDFVLGCRMVTGHGTLVKLGGEVMKNVAGYDVSRLMAGSYGCLGVLTEVSLKVLPLPRQTAHRVLACSAEQALQHFAQWRQMPTPVSAACFTNGQLHVRLQGGTASVQQFAQDLGGQELDPGFWHVLNENRLPFFADPRPLWRLSVPAHAPLQDLPGEVLIDWAGAQRWLKTNATEDAVRALVGTSGHATCYTAGAATSPFQPLAPVLLRYHQQLKQQMDPQGIFNPGRMYASF